MLVETRKTSHTPSELAESLINAFREKFGIPAGQNLAAYLWALVMLETASGSALWNENPGNMGVSNSSQDYFLLKNKSGEFYPNHYRDFSSLREGLENFLHEAVVRRPSMVKAAEANDAFEFATAYRDTKYAPNTDPNATSVTFKTLADRGLDAGYFASLPLKTDISALPRASASGSSSPSSKTLGSGVALSVILGSAWLLYAATRVRPKQ